jgi:hypothetical protein
MTTQVDAVILALRSVLADAEYSQGYYWETRTINRWINQLPGAWSWKWRHLKLRENSDRRVSRADAIVHLRATIVYLEENRDNIQAPSIRWPRWRNQKTILANDPRKTEYKIIEGPRSDTRH